MRAIVLVIDVLYKYISSLLWAKSGILPVFLELLLELDFLQVYNLALCINLTAILELITLDKHVKMLTIHLIADAEILADQCSEVVCRVLFDNNFPAIDSIVKDEARSNTEHDLYIENCRFVRLLNSKVCRRNI